MNFPFETRPPHTNQAGLCSQPASQWHARGFPTSNVSSEEYCRFQYHAPLSNPPKTSMTCPPLIPFHQISRSPPHSYLPHHHQPTTTIFEKHPPVTVASPFRTKPPAFFFSFYIFNQPLFTLLGCACYNLRLSPTRK